jgi:hypothetical protein
MRVREAAEDLAAAEAALKPVFDLVAALLGQAAGILLLAMANAEPERQRLHLISLNQRYRIAEDALWALPLSPRATAGFRAARTALPILGAILQGLEESCVTAAAGGVALAGLLARLADARRILLAGSAPGHGLGHRPGHGLALVDLSGACCAGLH